MNPFRMFGRHATLGVAAALMTLPLAACGSSGGGGGGSTSAGSGAGASTAAVSSAAPSSGGSAALPGKGKPAVTIGDKDFTEEFILGQLYAQALEAKGYTINLKSNIGSSEVIDKALTSGKIQMYPEYTGVIYTVLAGHDDNPTSAAATLAGATKFENGRGYAVLKPTPFQDADGVAVLKSFADQHGLKTISDLKKLGAFSYLGPPENATRYQGVLGLKQAYGLTQIQFKPLKTGSQYQAIDSGKADSIAIFTTDAQLASGKYTVLTDTKGIFGYQNVVPVIKQSVLTAEGPEFAAICNKVSALLTTPAIISMNKAVAIDQQDPAAVAKTFLKANGML